MRGGRAEAMPSVATAPTTVRLDLHLPDDANLAAVTHWVHPHDGVDVILTAPNTAPKQAHLHLHEDVTLEQIHRILDTLERHGCTVSLAYAPKPQWIPA